MRLLLPLLLLWARAEAALHHTRTPHVLTRSQARALRVGIERRVEPLPETLHAPLEFYLTGEWPIGFDDVGDKRAILDDRFRAPYEFFNRYTSVWLSEGVGLRPEWIDERVFHTDRARVMRLFEVVLALLKDTEGGGGD